MLLDNDVMAQRQAEAGALAGRLGGKERVENFLPRRVGYAGAVVAHPDLDPVAQCPGGHPQARLEPRLARAQLAFAHRVKAVPEQIQQNPGDLLRVKVDLADRRVEIPVQGDVETRPFGACPMIGEVQAFFDERVQVRRASLAGPGARMQQHVLDDAVGAPAVLDDFAEIGVQRPGQIADLAARRVGHYRILRRQRRAQLVGQFRRQLGEVVDEIERILDFMGNAGGQLAECGELLRLDQAVLRPVQISERLFGGVPGLPRFLLAGLQRLGARLDLCLQGLVRFPHLGCHLVEPFGQHLDLVAGADFDRLAVLARAEPVGAVLQPADRHHHAPRQHGAGARCQEQAERQQRRHAVERSVDRRQRLAERPLDKDDPAEPRHRCVDRQHLLAVGPLAICD